ncbi:MAG: hypothetical protein AAGN66_16190 [Acidobacteriota bacterium]
MTEDDRQMLEAIHANTAEWKKDQRTAAENRERLLKELQDVSGRVDAQGTDIGRLRTEIDAIAQRVWRGNGKSLSTRVAVLEARDPSSLMTAVSRAILRSMQASPRLWLTLFGTFLLIIGLAFGVDPTHLERLIRALVTWPT